MNELTEKAKTHLAETAPANYENGQIAVIDESLILRAMTTFAASHAAEAVKATLDDLVKAVEGIQMHITPNAKCGYGIEKADVLAEIEKLRS